MGLPLESPDRAEQITGHSLRATGAQGLAKAGLDLWAIQLLGRWGSEAVKLYVRQAALEKSASWASRAMRQMTLDDTDISSPDFIGARLRNLFEDMTKAAADKQSKGLRYPVQNFGRRRRER